MNHHLLKIPTTVAALALAVSICTPAIAVVAISDGFGDADINNNGITHEDVDVSVQGGVGSTTYIPGRLFIDGLSGEPTNNEIQPDEFDDPSDTGIRWLQMRGFTGAGASDLPGAGNSKPTIRIVDDTQGAMLGTQAGTGGLGIDAIDSGNAMSWESRGGGSSVAGFFDQNIQLGPEVDDEVSVSFDFRMWRDAPNLNGTNPNNVPSFGVLRFGLYQDTEGHIGQENPFAGRQVDEEGIALTDPDNTITPGDLSDSFRPAVFGQDEGLFEGSATGAHGTGDDVGTNGASGWSADVIFGSPGGPDGNNGGLTRIREEVNADRILQGSSDVETIVQPEDMGNGGLFDPRIYDFINLDLDKVYNIELSLTRATEVEEGDTIFAQLTYTDKETGMVVGVLGGNDDLDAMGNLPGINSDNWDFFGLRNQSNGAGEFDFIFDNFEVEVNGSNESDYLPDLLQGDFDGDGDVDIVDFGTFGQNFGMTGLPLDPATDGDFEPDGDVDIVDFGTFAQNFGMGTGSGSAVPEPASCLLVMLLTGVIACRSGRQR